MLAVISESLAGRAGFVELWPFTQGEISGKHDLFIDGAFEGPAAFSTYRPGLFSRHELLDRVCAGGYPEVQRLTGRQRPGWFRDYVRATIERDVVELSGIRKVAEMGPNARRSRRKVHQRNRPLRRRRSPALRRVDAGGSAGDEHGRVATHQLTAATSGPVILAGHGVCGSKALIATLRWRLIAVPGRLICRPGPFSTARGCQRAPVG